MVKQGQGIRENTDRKMEIRGGTKSKEEKQDQHTEIFKRARIYKEEKCKLTYIKEQ